MLMPKGESVSFLEFFKSEMKKRFDSKGNYGNWESAFKHLIAMIGKRDILCTEVTHEFVSSFKEYLINSARKSNNSPLSQNSKSSYFNKLRACIKEAVHQGLIYPDPLPRVKGIKSGDPIREYLTLEEVQRLAKEPCDPIVLKNAFLFSCVTGLRWSDVNKLTWKELQYSEAQGNYIRFTQKKTKEHETLPISEEAIKLMGNRSDNLEDRVFKGLKYSSWYNLRLKQWCMSAGISKDISFHCARHTYATLQLANGTDILTVSRLLGHKHLKTTTIYTKIIDSKKTEAASKINIGI